MVTGFDQLEAWVDILISSGLGLIVAVFVHFLYVRKMKKKLKEEKSGVEDCEKLISSKVNVFKKHENKFCIF